MRLEELSLFKAMIEDGEAGRFDNVRAAVEDTLGGYYRGVLPMVGTFTEGRALPVKSARTPIKTLRMALLPGWYVLYGKHPAALRDVDPEDEADVDGLESCRWKTASGNQSRDVWNVGVEKKYYDAAESHLLQNKFRARGTVFSRIEDEASRLWRAGGAIIMILVVSRREARLKVDAKDAPAAGAPAPWRRRLRADPPRASAAAYAPGAAAYAPPGAAAAFAPPGAAAAYAPPGAAARRRRRRRRGLRCRRRRRRRPGREARARGRRRRRQRRGPERPGPRRAAAADAAGAHRNLEGGDRARPLPERRRPGGSTGGQPSIANHAPETPVPCCVVDTSALCFEDLAHAPRDGPPAGSS
ncbi:hypothetical protein JL722_6857 [Aureococcus anophagefferens]|nr:hypothetical protein JL722_6857 [Aureococcus anophagefferens]